jgi:1-acyl-sn-glycerol-3-phosphate acyltransferase
MNFYLKRTGAHFVERFDPHQGAKDARKIMQTAESGDSLAIFPEGTFLEEPGLRPFHKGAFKIAARKGLPLVPMTIVGTRYMLSADSRLPRPGSLKVVISEPLQTTADMSLNDSMEHCRKRILDALDEPDLMATEGNPDSTG